MVRGYFFLIFPNLLQEKCLWIGFNCNKLLSTYVRSRDTLCTTSTSISSDIQLRNIMELYKINIVVHVYIIGWKFLIHVIHEFELV